MGSNDVEDNDTPLPPNHGKVWRVEDVQELRARYRQGESVTTLMAAFGRTRENIAAKLTPYARRDVNGYPVIEELYRIPAKTAYAINKEKTMQLNIENRQFVNGTDVKTMTLDDFVQLIGNAGEAIKKLEAVSPKPKALINRIEKLRTGIVTLVNLCDELFPE